MIHRKIFLLGSMLFAGLFASISQVQAAIIVGGSTLNGNFNADLGTGSRNFNQTPNWVNLGSGGQTAEATLDTLTFDGTRNAVVADNGTKIFALDTGHTILSGDVFDLSYVWRDAFNWQDNADQIAVRLFVTDDDTLSGTRTNLVQMLSGFSTLDNTYEVVDQNAVYTALVTDAGKRLFVDFEGVNGGGTNPGFARLDDFVLEVTAAPVAVPEPSSLSLFGLALAGCVAYCRIRRR